MAVGFDAIPQNMRVPLFYAEITNRQAGYFSQNQTALIIATKTSAGTALPNVPVLVTSLDQARAEFGLGSVLADMVDYYLRNDPVGELWALPVPETGGAAAGAVEITGTTTAAGTISLYVGGDVVHATIGSGVAANAAATALASAINATVPHLVSAAATPGTPALVTITAACDGVLGNEIDLRLNWGGRLAGEVPPAGLTLTVNAMTGGTGVPSLNDAFAAMGDDEYDFIAIPWTDTTTLDAIRDLMNDTSGRWAWSRQIYGHVFAARREASVGDLVTFGTARNDPHVSVLGFVASPTPSWRRAAALAATAASHFRADPARPLQTLPLVGILAPKRGEGMTLPSRQTLLNSGVATENAVAGVVQAERIVTTYQRNAWGQPDPSYLDVTTMMTLMYVVRFLRQRILQQFPRHKLADDGTPIGPGQAVVTPRIIRAEIIAAYSELMAQALVENMEAFQRFLIVERDQNDPNRINVLFPPDLVNQLRIFAAVVEFRLQYGADAAAA